MAEIVCDLSNQKRRLNRERRKVRWLRFKRTLRGLVGLTPEPHMDPVTWLAGCCAINVRTVSPCTMELVVEIVPEQGMHTDGMVKIPEPMLFAPIVPWHIPPGMKYLEHCCWVYMLTYPDLLPEPR